MTPDRRASRGYYDCCFVVIVQSDHPDSPELGNAPVTRGVTALTLPEIGAFGYSPVSQAVPHLTDKQQQT